MNAFSPPSHHDPSQAAPVPAPAIPGAGSTPTTDETEGQTHMDQTHVNHTVTAQQDPPADSAIDTSRSDAESWEFWIAHSAA